MARNLELNVDSLKSIENFVINVQETGEVDEECLLENISKSVNSLEKLNQYEYNSERAKGLLNCINALLYQVSDEDTVKKIIERCRDICYTYSKMIDYNLNKETRDISTINRLFRGLKQLTWYSETITKKSIKSGIVEKALTLLKNVNFLCKKDVNIFASVKLVAFAFENLANESRINNMDDINLFDYDKDVLSAYNAILSYLYSTSKWPSGKKEINKNGGLEIILNELKLLDKIPNEKNELIDLIKSRIILTLTYLVDNNQMNEIIEMPSDTINALVKFLKQAIDNGKSNRYRRSLNTKYYAITPLYYFASSIISDLIQISYNDKIKIKLINLDIIDPIKELLLNGNDIEIEKMCELLSYLSFCSYVAQYLRTHSMIKKWIEDVVKRTNRLETKRFCQQIIELAYSVNNSTGRIPQNKHILISYHEKYERECSEIMEKLKQKGYNNIWMQNWNQYDREDGELYKMMANGVKDASVVLICYSEEYRYDTNCRYEACYAASLGKPQIMIKMQEDYVPDSWLGLLVASKLYVIYTSKDERCRYDRLFEQLHSILGPLTQIPASNLNTNNQNLNSLSNTNAINWTQAEVKEWFISKKLENLQNLFHGIDGKCLKNMWDSKQKGFSEFYVNLDDKINNDGKYYKIRFQEKVDFYVQLQKLFN